MPLSSARRQCARSWAQAAAGLGGAARATRPCGVRHARPARFQALGVPLEASRHQPAARAELSAVRRQRHPALGVEQCYAGAVLLALETGFHAREPARRCTTILNYNEGFNSKMTDAEIADSRPAPSHRRSCWPACSSTSSPTRGARRRRSSRRWQVLGLPHEHFLSLAMMGVRVREAVGWQVRRARSGSASPRSRVHTASGTKVSP